MKISTDLLPRMRSATRQHSKRKVLLGMRTSTREGDVMLALTGSVYVTRYDRQDAIPAFENATFTLVVAKNGTQKTPC